MAAWQAHLPCSAHDLGTHEGATHQPATGGRWARELVGDFVGASIVTSTPLVLEYAPGVCEPLYVKRHTVGSRSEAQAEGGSDS